MVSSHVFFVKWGIVQGTLYLVRYQMKTLLDWPTLRSWRSNIISFTGTPHLGGRKHGNGRGFFR